MTNKHYYLIIAALISFVNISSVFGASKTENKYNFNELEPLGIELEFETSDETITRINSYRIIKYQADKRDLINFPDLGRDRHHKIFSTRDRTDYMKKLNNKYTLVLMTDVKGHEYITHILTLWEDIGKNYMFKCFVDHTIGVALGTAELTDVFQTTEDGYAINGITTSGDEGSIWSGLLIYPFDPVKINEPNNRPFRNDFWKCITGNEKP